MSKDKVAAPTSGTQDVSAILQMLGGTAGKSTTTQNPGDTAALQNVIGQLQGADYNALLQSIFQAAGGAIPGLQAAYGRSVGARSSNNAPVQAALNELLKQTTLAAQDKIVTQGLQNQQLQVQAGQGVAQATKGTTETKTAKEGTNVPKAAGTLAVLEALARLAGNKTVQDMVGKVTGGIVAPAATAGTATAPAAAAPIASAPAPQMQAAPMAQPTQQVPQVAAPMAQPVMQVPMVNAPVQAPMVGPMYSDAAGNLAPSSYLAADPFDFVNIPAPAPEYTPIFAEEFGYEG